MPAEYKTMMLTDPYELDKADVEEEILGLVSDFRMICIEDEDDLKESGIEAGGLLVWHSVPISAHTIKTLKKCKVIVSRAIGYNNIDAESAGEQGIYVCNVPDYCVDEVSDHVIGLMIALNRQIARLDRGIREGEWEIKPKRSVRRFQGMKLGILGSEESELQQHSKPRLWA